MPHSYTHQRRRRSKWAAYNRRRAADLEADRRRRLAQAAERHAVADAALIAAHEALHRQVKAKRPKPLTLRLRLTIDGHGSHQITAVWDDYARQWRPSKRSLLAGLAELLKAAPTVAAGPGLPGRPVGVV